MKLTVVHVAYILLLTGGAIKVRHLSASVLKKRDENA